MSSKEVSRQTKPDPTSGERFDVHFNLTSLVVFSVALILASGGLAFVLTRSLVIKANATASAVALQPRVESDPAPATTPPWGELITYDIEMDNPDEYMAGDYDTSRVPTWIFERLGLAQVRETLGSCGLSPAQTERTLSPQFVTVTATNTVVRPETELVLELSAEVRGKLYAVLAGSPANLYMYFPACFPAKSFDAIMQGRNLSPEVVGMVKRLLYARGDTQYFSDFEVVMQRASSSEERLRLLKVLTRQSCVLARVRIRPATDVDKILGYWTQSPGVRLKDLRPLLESVKRLPDGGTVSILYFLPPFVRERLYTYPMPPQPGEPAKDCHWSSLNFFNERPDDRLGDPGYAGSYLSKNYYPVQKPSAYGDVVLLMDEKKNGIHSAVYVADNIVFTKNGNNYLQPWMLMRLDRLVAQYGVRGPVQTAVYRHRSS